MTTAVSQPQHVLHVISHTHWDREWYLTFQQFRLRLVRVVDELLEIFESESDEDRQFRAFHLDGQAVVLEDYLEVRPDNRERLRRQIQAGRILVGPWYVLPDEFLISGESHVRNLIVGQQVVGRFGPSMQLGYLPDLFGHISQMPQLLKDAGYTTAVLWRGLSGEREGLRSELFWEAPDGSRVLCVHLPEQTGYSNANNLAMDAAVAFERVRGLRQERGQFAQTEHLLLMNGTDHHGAQRQLPVLLRELQQRFEPEGATIVHATLPEYVEAVRGTLDLDDRPPTHPASSGQADDRTPTHSQAVVGRPSSVVARAAGQAWDEVDAATGLQVRRGELRDVNRSGVLYSNFLLYAVASARVYIKQANHNAQQALERYAEPWSAVAGLFGVPYPQGFLSQSWKYLLQNHPHDSICGCSVDPVHEQMMTRFQWSQEIADGLTVEALHQLNARAAAPALEPGDVAFRLFNSLPWPRDEVVEATVYLPPDGQVGGADGPPARAFVLRDSEGNVIPSVVRGDRTAVHVAEHSGMRPSPRHVRSREITLAFRARVPATGYATFTVRPQLLPAVDRTPSPPDVTVGPNWLQNEYLRIDLDSNGLLWITQRATGICVSGGLVFEDGGDVGDEYTFSPPPRDRVVSSIGLQPAVSFIEQGPIAARLRIDVMMHIPAEAAPDRKSRSETTVPLQISTVLTLAAGSRRLECETTVENTAKDHRLRVLFPSFAHGAESHWVDQAFDVVERPNDYPQTPAEFWNEDAPDTHPQRLFVDLVGERVDEHGGGRMGLAILNQGIVEYGITGQPGGPRGLALTLLRGVQYLGGGAFPTTIRSGAGPHVETPGAQCLGSHTFRYAIVPHTGTWQDAVPGGLVREAVSYCTPPLAHPVDDTPLPWVPPWASVNQRRNAAALAASTYRDTPEQTLGQTESFLEIEGEAVMLSAFKRAEAIDQFEPGGNADAPLVLRLYNPTEQEQPARIRLHRPIQRAQRATILERPTEDLPLDASGTLPLTLGPKKIVTLLLDVG